MQPPLDLADMRRVLTDLAHDCRNVQARRAVTEWISYAASCSADGTDYLLTPHGSVHSPGTCCRHGGYPGAAGKWTGGQRHARQQALATKSVPVAALPVVVHTCWPPWNLLELTRRQAHAQADALSAQVGAFEFDSTCKLFESSCSMRRAPHLQVQAAEWRALAEERALTADSLRAELQRCQVGRKVDVMLNVR